MPDPSPTPETLADLLPLTPDVRAERLAELKRLFPDLFTNEGRLNPDELRQLVEPNEVHETERYEFKWYGKAASKREAFTPTTATLVYDEARSVNPDKADGNMIIEGENLETLKLLLNAYREQVKCIYIDPPYNTGQDFIYRDNYKKEKPKYWEETGVAQDGVQLESNPETSGRYHSDWLSMMNSRLLVARQLLRNDGVIFISSDGAEIQNVQRLLDDIFGEENFVGTLIWRKKSGGGQADEFFVTEHEYITVYRKSDDYQWLHETIEVDDASFTKEDDDGKYSEVKLAKWGNTARREDRPSMYFPVEDSSGKKVFPVAPDGGDGRWRVGKRRMELLMNAGLIVFKTNKAGLYQPYEKIYHNADDVKVVKERSILFENGETGDGSKELKNIFGVKDVFENPKPVSLISWLLQYNTSKDDLVLDFFGGSGTTAQAIAELNRGDGGERRCIIVQIPELVEANTQAAKIGLPNISSITIERVKRVIQGYGDNPQPMSDAGFKVYRLQKSNFPRCEFKPDPAADDVENVAALRRYIEEKEAAFFLTLDDQGAQAVFDEVLLKNGFQLHYTRTRREDFPENTVFEVRDPRRSALVCLAWNESIKDSTIKRLRDLNEAGESPFFICLERSLTTTSKWNLRHFLGKHFNAF